MLLEQDAAAAAVTQRPHLGLSDQLLQLGNLSPHLVLFADEVMDTLGQLLLVTEKSGGRGEVHLDQTPAPMGPVTYVCVDVIRNRGLSIRFYSRVTFSSQVAAVVVNIAFPRLIRSSGPVGLCV